LLTKLAKPDKIKSINKDNEGVRHILEDNKASTKSRGVNNKISITQKNLPEPV